ncbi:3-deoxy-D-manno-octulosonic acid transferase [Mesobacterium pallidum]|uniref:3-deoxy-D-manno-octulosonic acid transferase n=1 Tax=Mesobacterium pallidum TaxID=2872037 RepID=UPI001EE24879|nr:glycosyltransferase N-terminal domain-containing protein [Mesobacterium pallidum]
MLAYRLLLSLIALVMIPALALRALRGRESWAVFGERLGFGAATDGPVLWIHGASNGELAPTRPLIEAIAAARPDLALLVTSNSTTARDMIAGWGLAARCAPLDLGPCLSAFLRRHDVQGYITLEKEFWPQRHARLAAQSAPILGLASAMSEATARAWSRLPVAARAALTPVARAWPQDTATGPRLVALGLDPAALGPVTPLKAGYTAPERGTDPMLAGLDRADTWLAASTHPGEEAEVIAAHLAALKSRPALRLILAPRHPRRVPEVAALLDAAGLPHRLRSHGTAPAAGEVLLVDTMGEMALFYDAASACFVGGSLVPGIGGHTPYEPAAHGSAILHGPHVANHATAFAALTRADAAIAVAHGPALAVALSDPAALAALPARASAALAGSHAAQTDRVLAGILAALKSNGAPD